MMKNKVFSGIRPSGKLHLGNYLGAIKNWIELQDNVDPADGGASQAIFAVVDYHGITTPYDPKTYQEQITDTVIDYLSAGIDPSKSLIIRQSKVPQHTELMWLFSTITPIGWLERLPNYREKLEQVESSGAVNASSYQSNLSLLAYPVLMASDILLYKSNLVPVGEDQLVHLNLTNEIGAKFNHLFGDTFPNVKAHITTGARIMSLLDPTKKMSKSGDDGIALSDKPDIIRAKIKKAVTDSGKEIKFDPENKPAISNLIEIYHLLSGKSVSDVEEEYSGKTYVQFKEELGEVVVDFLKPFQKKYAELKGDVGSVVDVLEKSEEKARTIASTNLQEIKEHMGLK